VLLQKAELPG